MSRRKRRAREIDLEEIAVGIAIRPTFEDRHDA
jgi:hypothetical protein